ncbi:hypothetical protein Clacol_000605 [Clathrus columnatus]|uniref:Conserved oligomeric Golgi complex subunit 3 n=1 Tax=Clathrus columnatus TaxID=1419009 RepID=A0AAV5A116_9AGAM|nr:hypothetical protein Clacol_000605 [Clathrus columnatus]
MSSIMMNGHPKSTVNLEEWESQAPLDDLQVKSINALKTLCQERRLPLKFRTDYSSRPSSPSTPAPNLITVTSRPETPLKSNGDSKLPCGYLHPKEPIETPEQFHDWFAAIERSIVHSQDAHFRAHLEDVSHYRLMCENLLHSLNDLESELDSIFVEWRRVEENGRSLKDACEQLLQERDNLLETTQAISLRLEYFQELEHATRMLNHPGESLVLQAGFLLMVERVDVCLEYLQSHSQQQDFREAEIYTLRFQQCLMRAMTLIKMYFVTSLRALTTDVQRRISDKIAPLLAELERRAEKYSGELGSLLVECHSAYFSSRKSLLFPRVTGDIKGLEPKNSDLVELVKLMSTTRNGCTYMRQLCIDETTLYSRFFHTGEDHLSRYLEILSDFLFDDLRPRILHESRLVTLCEVCTVLRALIDLDVDPTDINHDVNYLSGDDDNPQQRNMVRPYIRPILQLVLQDAQTRLLFKAQTLMESEIRFFKPSPDDITYPSDLQPQSAYPLATKELFEKEEGLMKLLPASIYHRRTWYHTINKTLWILSQLYDFVNPVVFNDIAQEAIDYCRQSLKVAADQISSNTVPDSISHGQLFLIRHLLILKDIAVQLNLSHQSTQIRPELDTLGTVLRNTSALFQSSGILSLVGSGETPSINARSEIDNDLKSTCDKFIFRCAENAVMPLRTFLEHSNTPRPSKDDVFAQPPKVIQLYEDFCKTCGHTINASLELLNMYLQDERTVRLLMIPIKTKIMEVYNSFQDVVGKEYGNIVDKFMSPPVFSDFLDGLNANVNSSQNKDRSQ